MTKPFARRDVAAIASYDLALMRRLTALALFLFAATAFADVKSIAARFDGVTGVTAVHIPSGRRITLNPNEAFPMASVYKFPIAIAALREVDAGRLSLDKRIVITKYHPGHSPLREETGGKRAEFPVRRLINAMVTLSDNTASDVLMELVGGAAKITKTIGTPGIRIDRTELQMADDLKKSRQEFLVDPRDTSTPAAMADLLVRFWKRELGLSKSSHQLLVEAMLATSTGPNRIRAGVPAKTKVAHKTGTWSLGANDVGVIDGEIAIAVFTKGGKATTAEREAVIAAIAKEVRATLAR
jgi:beta-lactamase class A